MNLNDTQAVKTFTEAYIEALVWSSTLINEDGETEECEGYALSEDGHQSCEEVCKAFVEAYGDLITKTMELHPSYSIAQAGQDFALTRNRHGSGFWDRGLGDWGHLLTGAAHSFGGTDVYLNADGQLGIY